MIEVEPYHFDDKAYVMFQSTSWPTWYILVLSAQAVSMDPCLTQLFALPPASDPPGCLSAECARLMTYWL